MRKLILTFSIAMLLAGCASSEKISPAFPGSHPQSGTHGNENSAGVKTAGQAGPQNIDHAAPVDNKTHALVFNLDAKQFKSHPDMHKILHSAADQLWVYFPKRRLNPINIVYDPRGPMVYFKRDPGNRVRMRLSSTKTYWCQHAYQFAHEFCHIMSNYDSDPNQNDWFEESVCELASIFVLRKMHDQWGKEDVVHYAKRYRVHLKNYAQNLINRGEMPAGETLATWYAKNETQLYKSSTQRQLNRIVAVALLPMFEAEPENWGAMEYLNKGVPHPKESFKTHLIKWKKHSPARFRPFITKIGKKFGYEI